MVYNWNDFRDHPDLDVEWSDDIRGRSRLSWRRKPRVLEQQLDNQKNNILVGVLLVSLAILIGAVAFVSNDMSNNGPRLAEDDDNSDKMVAIPQKPSSPYPSQSISTFPSELPSLRPSQRPSFVSSSMPSSSSAPSPSPSGFLKAPPAPTPTIQCINQEGVFYNHKGENVTCDWFETVGSYIHKRNCGKTGIGRACLLSCASYYNCHVPDRSINETQPPTEHPSNAPTNAPSNGIPKSMTVTASGDTTIKESSPNANLGSASWIKIDTDSGVFHALVKFDLTGHVHSRRVESATLRLKAASDCPSGGYIQRTHNPNWDENSVTWSTAPGGDGTEVARLKSIKRGYWYTVDVKKALSTGHNVLSLRLFPVSASECMFESKENSSGNAPVLNIIYGD